MNEQAWVSHWKNVYEAVFLVGPPAMKQRPTPTDEHLDRLESVISRKLPASYRAFAKVFGPGIVSQSVFVYSPGFRSASNIDFLGNNKWQQYEATRRSDPEQIETLVGFASLAHQDIVWNPSAITNLQDLEYEIFYLPKESSEPLVKICDSFSTFIEEWCFTGKYWELLGSPSPNPTWEDEETGEVHSMKCFNPIGERPTSRV